MTSCSSTIRPALKPVAEERLGSLTPLWVTNSLQLYTSFSALAHHRGVSWHMIWDASEKRPYVWTHRFAVIRHGHRADCHDVQSGERQIAGPPPIPVRQRPKLTELERAKEVIDSGSWTGRGPMNLFPVCGRRRQVRNWSGTW